MRAGAGPRVAFFTDCYYEVNGVARTSRELVRYARERELPLLAVHAGAETRVWKEGSVTHCEFRRGFPSLRLDADVAFDLAFYWRHRKPVEAALLEFGPEVVHGTGPSDCGLLGLILAHRYRVPMLATWHTNVHEYAGRRVRIPGVEGMAEQASLSLVSLYYQYARRTLAPNPELVAMLETRTGKPSGLMERGIDTSQFQPGKRVRECDGSFRIGYVGRLSREKNVRLLVDIQEMLRAAGAWPFHFCVVGQGDELGYLRRRLEGAIFPGVLRGEALSRAYADMDAFVFPSETDTYGNVVQEALASGVPALVTGRGGPKYLVRDGETGFVCGSAAGFADAILRLMSNGTRRAEMRVAARRWALARDWSAIFDGVYEAYGQCLGRVNPDPRQSASPPDQTRESSPIRLSR